MNRNKIIFIVVLLLLGILFIVTTCYRSGEKSNAAILPPGTHGVSVIEVIQTSNYTYLQVEENNKKFWIAIVRADAKPGDSVYYTNDSEMKDFLSKELGRTFPSIYFVQDPSNKLKTAEAEATQLMTPKKVEIVRWSDISVETPKGGISIAELYKNKDKYAEKTVIIRGKIVRYNHAVMNKNWVHIQDGTDFSDKFDLTVTTMDSLTVGKIVTFRGIIRLDKDFGSGYKYDVIMEEAKASDIKPAE
ncbi:MAG: GW dipeptide domain-containing protein [Bacteroidota bacterium]